MNTEQTPPGELIRQDAVSDIPDLEKTSPKLSEIGRQDGQSDLNSSTPAPKEEQGFLSKIFGNKSSDNTDNTDNTAPRKKFLGIFGGRKSNKKNNKKRGGSKKNKSNKKRRFNKKKSNKKR